MGSKIAILLADKGYDVTALVRSDVATIRDPHHGTIRYVTGDLADEASMMRAVEGVDVVISTGAPLPNDLTATDPEVWRTPHQDLADP